tara:strand:+ start:424 stop:537 length:114 start_codon:yes stop_codon:yes gene_type:complete
MARKNPLILLGKAGATKIKVDLNKLKKGTYFQIRRKK